MSVKAVLFDLDGTLLDINMDDFLRRYMAMLAPTFAHLVPPGQLADQVGRSTAALLVKRDRERTLRQAFFDTFCPAVGHPEAVLWPVFEAFHREQFPRLAALARPAPAARAVQAALDAGFDIALATDPLFPHFAIRERMRWADVDHFPWRFVAALDDMYCTKPHPEYYLDIAERLGRHPAECLMVGNEEKDWAAERAGMQVLRAHAGDLEAVARNLAGLHRV